MRVSTLGPMVSAFAMLLYGATATTAADLGTVEEASTPPPSAWAWRATSYGWLTWLDGSVTVRHRSFDVDATPRDVIDALDFAVMGTLEARRGPWSLWTDVVYANLGSTSDVVTTRLANGSQGSVVSANLQMTTVEAAAAYELLAGAGHRHVDIYAGARYWDQRTDVTLNVSGTADVAGLEVSGATAIARSGAVDWVDPFLGLRYRQDLPFGGEAFIRADVGGFGAGSEFSWQAIAAVNWHICNHSDIAWDAYLGYRALYVDYEEGEGSSRYEYDVTEHGPVLGLTGRF